MDERPAELRRPGGEELFDEVASEEDIATEEQKLTKGQIFVKYVLMNKVIWLLCFANIFLYVVRIGIDQWSTVYAHQELGFSKEIAIQGFTFFEVGALVGTLIVLAGLALDRWVEVEDDRMLWVASR